MAYGKAIAFGAEDVAVAASEVELERLEQVEACMRYNDLLACDTAVVPGADDEFDLQQKRGGLLAAEGELEAALEDMKALPDVSNPGYVCTLPDPPATVDHIRVADTNFGARVDCWAWGNRVTTLSWNATHVAPTEFLQSAF